MKKEKTPSGLSADGYVNQVLRLFEQNESESITLMVHKTYSDKTAYLLQALGFKTGCVNYSDKATYCTLKVEKP